MRSARTIEKLIKRMSVTPDAKSDQMILDDMFAAQEQAKELSSADTSANIWSTIMKSKMARFATAAVMVSLVVVLGVSLLNGGSAWAKVVRAFNEVENVHVVQRMTMADGTVEQHELWLRRPNHLYEDRGKVIIIDDGKERLLLNKDKQTGQFSDSFMPFKPLEEHYMFDPVGWFRGQSPKGIESRLLSDESDDSTLVFGMGFRNETPEFVYTGKAWVDAVTMLPQRIHAELTTAPKENNPKSVEILFDYEAIADDVFAMTIPRGFTELPRKQRGVLSGKVLGENEEPVANAIVYAVDRGGVFFERVATDIYGRFTMTLPPEGAGTPLWLPVLFRAFTEDTPGKVAWSVIRDPRNRHEPGGGWEPGGTIPYDVAHVDHDGCMLRSANGITLRMEPAGMIVGHVTDANGDAISDAKVQLLRCELADKHGNAGLTGIDVHKWGGADGHGVVRTDENGWYELANLPRLWKRTKFVVRAEAGGFAGDTARFYAKGPIEREEVDFRLYQARLTVKGRLIDNYGNPVVGAPIFVLVNGKRFQTCNAKADERGFFKIEGCPDTQDLQIEAPLSHGFFRRGRRSGEYFPDVVNGIDYLNDKDEYEVEMVARKAELILDVEVKNTSGEQVKYFPVEIRGDAGEISTQWAVDKRFIRRTDENGRCTFTEVPEVAGLRLILHGGNNIPNEEPGEELQRYIAENKKMYFWSEAPIEVVDGKKEYHVTAVALTKEEWDARRDTIGK